MSYIKTKGIVIKEVNLGEADKIVTVFSKSHGKMSCFAKAARRPKSRLVGGTQFLCYSEFVMYKGKDMFSINSCDVIEPFYSIRNELDKLTYAAHMTEIIGDTVQENQPASKVLQLFLNTLHMLANTDKNPELLVRIFEIRLLSILGYAPYVRGCMECGNEALDSVSFSFKKCGLLCPQCMAVDEFALEITPGTAKTLLHIVYSRAEELFNFNVSPLVLEQLGRVSRRFLRERLEKEYTRLDFLKELKTDSFSL